MTEPAGRSAPAARFPSIRMDMTSSNYTAAQLSRPLCVNGTQWILYLLEECVDNVWEYCSVVIGLVSMFCFLLSTFPQVYEAYRNGKVEQAMSFGFLLFLFSGDMTSFAGCYLTSQLPIQLVTVVFYIFTDLILISQFLYYKIKNSSTRKSPVLKWLCFTWCAAGTLVLLALPKLIIDNSVTLDSQNPSTSKSIEFTGYVCGYLASVFYLCSRFPQLYKNFQRQSTEGTSYLLFALAMMGNGTYGLSVIVVLPALRGSKQTFIIKHLAWLIGSLGVLILDFLVTAQFIMYRKNKSAKSKALLSVPEVEPLLCEEEEFSV
ncbi:lysosomal amino acid transporter 1 homolog [Solea solea]|uniref:lysosomal amino acid transporter 1 homolog n=1 Tax=Solea solea TaxID=90069 RepID=UPI002729749E|nr:lysosomal amino acid transporter 1 homolog [Solea solea]XP_058491013.1 lysosomal amino acid transporter 1 homolog [Solea solea]